MNVPTIILDGFLGRPARWERLRRRIERETAAPATIFRYDSTGRAAMPRLAELLLAEVWRVSPTNAGVNLVGYSMGGIIIRTAKSLDRSLNVRRAVFMNSPHRGTWIACLIPTPGVRQMRPFDPHLLGLNKNEWTVPTLIVWNGFDGIVLPGRNTRYDNATGCEHVRCAVPIHIWPVWSTRIHKQVAAFLKAPTTNELTEASQ
jgi:triacylglycerol lipase